MWKITWAWLWLVVPATLVLAAGILLRLSVSPEPGQFFDDYSLDPSGLQHDIAWVLIVVGAIGFALGVLLLAASVRRASCHRCGAPLTPDSTTCTSCGFDFVKLPERS